ncbi:MULTISPECIES: hypothetical protein [unclassified Psychrosphaera]|uniref:hypothetical protein n=1 Tax=unclassified Psychrosphaera TaxID=2641570 RepID=UPI002090C227|nr:MULTISPECIES: hypothetical protein [unclassified Psychrosphaera]
MTSSAYVFIDGLEGKPVICAIVELDPVANVGKFRYGKSYFQRDDAFPLESLHLPSVWAMPTTILEKSRISRKRSSNSSK